MNIESVYVSKNKDTGIYYIKVNTLEKWFSYQIERCVEKGKLIISTSVSYSVEYMPGQFDDYDKDEEHEIVIEEGFNSYDYFITSMQEKDQITIICIPRDLILNKFFKEV